MKTQGKVWIIYNSMTKAQTKPMSVVQAQVLLLSLSHAEHGKYFLWTPGWEKWVTVRDFLDSDQRYFVMARPPEPIEGSIPQEQSVTENQIESPYTQVDVGAAPLRREDICGYHSQDFNGDDLDLSKIKKIKPANKSTPSDEPGNADRRKEARHDFKIEVVLVSKTRSFRTHSKNISLSGTMLEEEVPRDFLNQPFDLIFLNPFEADPKKARLHFQAKFVGDHKDPRRLMFFEQDAKMTMRLDALLKAYVAYQEQVRKTAG